MSATPGMVVDAFVAEIRSNVDAFYADAITHEAFSARQRDTWSRASDANVQAQVARILSEKR